MVDIPDSTATAATLAIGGAVSSTIDSAGDVDWFRVALTASQPYTFRLNGSETGNGTLFDPFIRGIYDASGGILADTSNDDDGPSLNARVTFTPTTSGTYYVAAGAFSSYTGSYQLSAALMGTGTVAIGDVTIAEGNAGTPTAFFTVARTGGTGAFSVNFATGNDTATAGSDYAATSGTLSFDVNETSRTISVTINGDTTVEPNETFVVDLSGATNGATISDTRGIGTIISDDAAPSVSIGDVAIVEGNAGTRTAFFTVARTGGTGAFSVNFATGNDTATAGSDYAATSGTLSFDVNETSRTISVTINGDTTVEPNETFVVDLSGATNGATISDTRGIGTIINDEPAVATLGDVLWRHMDGTVTTADHPLGAIPNTWSVRGVGDFDGDGDSDILWRHQDGLVVLWEMENGQYLTNHNIAFASTGWDIVGLGDFDDDGDADVMWRHRDGAVVTWEMENNAYVINHNIAFASTGWRIDGFGDFDRDGDDDVIWRHQEGAVVTWEMENGGYVVNHNIAFGATSWQIQGTGDFDRDGDDDILWRHDSGIVTTWEMENGAYVSNHNIESGGGTWYVQGVHDFDHDGDADVLWRHEDGMVVTWEMQNGGFLQTHNYGVVSNAWQIRGTGEFDLL